MKLIAAVVITSLLPSLALAQAPATAPTAWTGRLLPARLCVIGLVLRAPRGRAGRDSEAADRDCLRSGSRRWSMGPPAPPVRRAPIETQ